MLVNHRRELVSSFVEKLLTYGMGRGVEYYDRPVIRSIMRDAEPKDYCWSSIILGITKSMPFKERKSRERD